MCSAGQVKKPQRKVKHKRKAKLSDKPTTETSKITTEDTDQFYKVHTLDFALKALLDLLLGSGRKISKTDIICCFEY